MDEAKWRDGSKDFDPDCWREFQNNACDFTVFIIKLKLLKKILTLKPQEILLTYILHICVQFHWKHVKYRGNYLLFLKTFGVYYHNIKGETVYSVGTHVCPLVYTLDVKIYITHKYFFFSSP